MKNLGCKRESFGFPVFFMGLRTRPAEIEICERGKHQSAVENEFIIVICSTFRPSAECSVTNIR
jgi:hypothetical protein